MWAEKRIFDLGKVLTGSTPSTSNPLFWGEEIPFISPSDFSDEISQVFNTERSLSSKGAAISPTFPKSTVLTTCIGSIGKMAISCIETASCNQQINALICNKDNDPIFVFYCIKHNINKLKAISGATTIPIVNKNTFGNIKIKTPDKKVQTIIANILDTLDTQIRQTEAIIAKLQQIKQGLLHDLLTRGIDENGQLRPPYEQAPELYKASPLGWIPKEWEVLRLTTLSENGLSNGVFKEPKRVGKGVPLVNVADLYRGDRLALEGCELFDASPGEVKRYGARKGDIFFTRSSLKLEGIAQTSYLNSEAKSAVYECHVMRLRPKKSLVFPRYLKEWCVGNFARKHFMEHAKQVTMTTISQDGIAGLLCPKPDLDEQEKCVAMIESHESRILKELNLVEKLKKQKAGLMDDLLTGRVRVTELIEQQQAS
ncbi:restriction endonuclease subunit S [Vreelandella sp. V005]|uniref:restriction endonuclease subunit S n=1 Tax=Vreelandella sp. V005 TaxID=3459608 RepID=UPI004045076B